MDTVSPAIMLIELNPSCQIHTATAILTINNTGVEHVVVTESGFRLSTSSSIKLEKMFVSFDHYSMKAVSLSTFKCEKTNSPPSY